MGQMIKFSDNEGHDLNGYLAEPLSVVESMATSQKVPGVVVIHEWWGLQDQIKHVCDRYAEAGLRALGVDLYHGVVAKDAAQAGELMGRLNMLDAVQRVIGPAVSFLKVHSRKVGVSGYCMGGAVTVMAAAHLPSVDAAVMYYGIPDPKKFDVSKIKTPFAAHFANRDTWVTLEKAKHFAQSLESVNSNTQSWFYEADHAFCNERRAEVYNAELAQLAWERTISFFKKYL